MRYSPAVHTTRKADGEPARDMVADDHRPDATQRERERSPHLRPSVIDRDEEEIHHRHREGEGERLVGVLGIESVELGTSRVDQHADAART